MTKTGPYRVNGETSEPAVNRARSSYKSQCSAAEWLLTQTKQAERSKLAGPLISIYSVGYIAP
jgi:hypothetical protein